MIITVISGVNKAEKHTTSDNDDSPNDDNCPVVDDNHRSKMCLLGGLGRKAIEFQHLSKVPDITT